MVCGVRTGEGLLIPEDSRFRSVFLKAKVEKKASVHQYDHDVFGKVTIPQETVPQELKFTGAVTDEAHLHHLYSHFYNPAIGRFITQDTFSGSPWEPWTQNLYVYVGSNPINYVDPTGHEAQMTASPSPIVYTESSYAGTNACSQWNQRITVTYSSTDIYSMLKTSRLIADYYGNLSTPFTKTGLWATLLSGLTVFTPAGAPAALIQGLGGATFGGGIATDLAGLGAGTKQSNQLAVGKLLEQAKDLCSANSCSNVSITGLNSSDHSNVMTGITVTVYDVNGNVLATRTYDAAIDMTAMANDVKWSPYVDADEEE